MSLDLRILTTPKSFDEVGAILRQISRQLADETHHTTHENGGADELSVAGLSGLLADGQTPLAHKTSHQNTGADEIDVGGLSGVLADAQNADRLNGNSVPANPMGKGLLSNDGSGNLAFELVTTTGLALLDDATTGDQRTTLGLGGAAVLNVGTAAGTVAAGDHAHSGVYQPADAELSALAGLASAADKLPYFTGDGTAALVELTEQTLLGRLTGGHVAALTAAQVNTLLGVNRPVFSVYLNADKTMTLADTYYELTSYTTIVRSSGSISNGRYTPGVAGYYYVTFKGMYYTVSASKFATVIIYVNATTAVSVQQLVAPVATAMYLNANAIVYLDADDYISVFCKAEEAGKKVYGAQGYTELSAWYLGTGSA